MRKIYTLLFLLIAAGANSQTITTIAGTGYSGFTADGVPATSSGVYTPYDIGMDSLANLFIGDVGNNRIRKIDPSGIITTVAGTGVAGYNGDGIIATSAQLNFPYGMAVNYNGTIVITDMDNNRIRSIQSETGGVINTIAGTGVAGYSGDGGPAVAAMVNNPQGIMWDHFYNVYFSDAFNHRVRKISNTGVITTIGGNGLAASSGDGGPATAASINHPSGITADDSGNIYVAEMLGNRIRKISSAGIITTVAGNGSPGFSGDGGPATAASLRFPKGICIDRQGNLIIGDSDNQRIRKINIITGIITTIAGTGVAAYGGDGGPATAAKFNYLQGVYVDTAGNLYIGDCLNNRVRKIACVPPAITPISGLDTVCIGDTISLTSTTPGGSWNASNAHATVSTSGAVIGHTVGMDTVIYSIANSCITVRVSHPVYVKSCTTEANSIIGSKVAVFPNPASTVLSIVASSRLNEVTITNIAGKTVYITHCDNRKITVDIANLSPGTYCVKINGVDAGKFVKL